MNPTPQQREAQPSKACEGWSAVFFLLQHRRPLPALVVRCQGCGWRVSSERCCNILGERCHETPTQTKAVTHLPPSLVVVLPRNVSALLFLAGVLPAPGHRAKSDGIPDGVEQGGGVSALAPSAHGLHPLPGISAGSRGVFQFRPMAAMQELTPSSHAGSPLARHSI